MEGCSLLWGGILVLRVEGCSIVTCLEIEKKEEVSVGSDVIEDRGKKRQTEREKKTARIKTQKVVL